MVKKLFVYSAILWIAALMLATALVLASPPAVVAGPDDCREGDPRAGAIAPERLKVLAPCATAEGTVVLVHQADDGDWHIVLLPDPNSVRLLGRTNVTHLAGMLMVEVIPRDQSAIAPPHVGDRIAVTGSYVVDTPHGWREIHPAWRLRVLSPSPLPGGLTDRMARLARSAARLVPRLPLDVR